MLGVTPFHKAALLLTASVLILPEAAAAAQPNYEYKNQPSLDQIGVTPSLHNRVSGKGVAVAILDGFAGASHLDLQGKTTDVFVYPGKYDLSGWSAIHGTHVAGIAAGNRNGAGIVGVAPDAHVYNMPMFDNTPCSSSVACRWVGFAGRQNDYALGALNRVRSLNAQGADIAAVNMSFVSMGPGDNFAPGELKMFSGFRNDFVIARAAGNAGKVLQSEAYDGVASATLSHLLIVGSVGLNDRISSFSNTPGAACIGSTTTNCAPSERLANFFIVAPGENVNSACPGCNYTMPGGWTPMSGTSMATPHVTGAVALVVEDGLKKNVKLTPSDVASILKKSATDLGPKGVDGTYGWGLMNLEAALQPVGPTVIPTSPTAPNTPPAPPSAPPPPSNATPPAPPPPPAPTPPPTPPSASNPPVNTPPPAPSQPPSSAKPPVLTPPPSSSSSPARQNATQNYLNQRNAIALFRSRLRRDSSGRLFLAGLAGMKEFDEFGRPFDVDLSPVSENEKTTLKMLRRLDGARAVSQEVVNLKDENWSLHAWAADNELATSSVRFATEQADIRFAVGAPDVYFGLGQGRIAAGEGQSLDGMMFAGLGKAEELFTAAAGTSVGLRLNDDWNMTSYAVRSLNGAAVAAELRGSLAYTADTKEASLAGVGITRRINENWGAGMSYGVLHETGSVVGDPYQGPLSFGKSTLTQTVGMTVSGRFADRFALDGFYSMAFINGLGRADSVFGTARGWTGNQFGIVATADRIFTGRDALRLSAIKPLQVTGGTLHARIPVGRQFDGTIVYESRSLDFAADAMPGNLRLEYLSPWGALQTSFSLQITDEDILTRGDVGYGVGAGLSYTF